MQIGAILFTTPGRLQRLIAPLSDEQIDAPPAPGKWCIREIVAHLADCELVFGFRLRQTLRRSMRLSSRSTSRNGRSDMRDTTSPQRWGCL